MRADSPFVLAVVGTLAVHVLLFTATDAMSTLTRGRPEPAPHFDVIDIDVPEPPPPPPAAVAPEPTHTDPTPTTPTPAPQVHRAAHARVETPHSTAAATDTPPPTGPPAPTGPTTADGVDRGWSDDDGTAGPRDAHGTRGAGRGHGVGSGGGGDGSGTTPAPPAPPAPSIATIKQRALPRGDYGVLEAGRDYPAEAKQLGIEGDLRVRLLVDVAGHVASATLLGHLGHGLDELALRQARQIAFDPAIDTDDRPTASIVVWTFHFTLPR